MYREVAYGLGLAAFQAFRQEAFSCCGDRPMDIALRVLRLFGLDRFRVAGAFRYGLEGMEAIRCLPIGPWEIHLHWKFLCLCKIPI